MRYTEFNLRAYETHMMVYNLIQDNSSVLDLGCATGYFAEKLNRKNCDVWGIDSDEFSLKISSKYCKKVIRADLNNFSLNSIKKKFDVIIALDLIEHLTSPDKLLNGIKKLLKEKGVLIISTPNIAHIRIRLNLLLGKFSYEEKGIMDKTHVHFFTRNSLSELLQKYNYKIEHFYYPADFGQLPVIGRFLKYLPKAIAYRITSLFPSLLSAQIIAVCK